jgi:FAD:protein FMN transferase
MNIHRKLKAVGKEIEFLFYDANPETIDFLMKETEIEEKRLEKIFNFYDPKSELSKLNKKRSLNPSKELFFVIKKAIAMSKLTHGRYDVTLGKNFLERKSSKELSKLSCSYRDILIKGNLVSLNHPDALIDLGSIAKGYIVDCLAKFIKSLGIKSCLIDARGDMRISGKASEDISIQHPRNNEDVIESFVLKNKSVATSGDYNQYSDSYERSHLLNSSEFISVTVICDNLIDADALATGLFVSEENELSEILKKFKCASAFIVKKDLKLIKHNWKK